MRFPVLSAILLATCGLAAIRPVLALEVMRGQHRLEIKTEQALELAKDEVQYKTIIEFLKAYARAAEGDVSELANFYETNVLYYDRGYVDREKIIAERKSIERRFPTRKYRLLEDTVRVYARDTYFTKFNVIFESEYEVKNSKVTKAGRWKSEIKLKSQNGRWLIYDQAGGRVKSD